MSRPFSAGHGRWTVEFAAVEGQQRYPSQTGGQKFPKSKIRFFLIKIIYTKHKYNNHFYIVW